MATTVASIQTPLNTYIGDSSTDRISAAERLNAITEATIWLQEELQNDLQVDTYDLNYYDTVYNYKITTAVADLLDGADLRRGTLDQDYSFARKSPRELAEEIGQSETESSWAIERRDSDAYLVVNHASKYQSLLISDFDSTTSAGGTWTLDTTNGDGTNLTVDVNEKTQGSGSLNFDLDVSQTANNKAVIYNDEVTERDLSDYEDLGAWLLDVYIPDATYSTSFTLYWGNSSTSYWSATSTTDINGGAWVNGWNTVKVNWTDATATSSPDATAVDYLQVDYNYNGSQADETDLRYDNLRLVRPEKLKFHYLSWYVGTDTTGATNRTAFSATTDIPYFSGQYDQYIYPIAHKAASIIFKTLRLPNEAAQEEVEALKALRRIRTIHPSSKLPEVKSFKVMGVSFKK